MSLTNPQKVELLSIMADKVIAQGGFAINERSQTCLYRDRVHNRRCMIGGIIKDEFYQPIFEDKTPAQVPFIESTVVLALRRAIQDSLPEYSITEPSDWDFFTRAQRLHDSNAIQMARRSLTTEAALEQFSKDVAFAIEQLS
jgi:hypothetical protein